MPHAQHRASSLRLSLMTLGLMSLFLLPETGRSQSADLDVSTLDAGIYLVRATNGLTEEVIRLVVE